MSHFQNAVDEVVLIADKPITAMSEVAATEMTSPAQCRKRKLSVNLLPFSLDPIPHQLDRKEVSIKHAETVDVIVDGFRKPENVLNYTYPTDTTNLKSPLSGGEAVDSNYDSILKLQMEHLRASIDGISKAKKVYLDHQSTPNNLSNNTNGSFKKPRQKSGDRATDEFKLPPPATFNQGKKC